MTFRLEIANWVSRVKVDMDEAFRGLALEVARRIIERTPVESGNARGAWVAAVNGMPTAGDPPDDTDGAATLARIAAVIATAKVGDTIFIANNADYAHALEFGKSDQSPGGMVRVTLMEAQAIAGQVVAKLR
ncbi:Bacteriophage HK97-gp10, putative tail-component [Bradyrhizobium sp. Rc2d]|uniref:HK97 gp10 family phage protein n=1 Tax=Bradyrhizobium sp. Rc2d TaxID=1855321 RepID=UPI00088B8B4B|nr:HK97 gp10 family phage protein [Bradyrhizobium sp. Rc2d]SDJ34278.1 Bacteriophage HK97-gp10, putative tail-component [Bradyrhizobium sp. Rc2d]